MNNYHPPHRVVAETAPEALHLLLQRNYQIRIGIRYLVLWILQQ